LETKLQLKRVTDEKLTHMLSIQKSPTDKTRLGYVASSSSIPSTSKTVFVKPTVPKPPFVCLDKGKLLVGMFWLVIRPLRSLLPLEGLIDAIIVG
jgi:hypothetical protein